MTNLRSPRVPGGSVGQQVSLGGEIDPRGNPAGNTITRSFGLKGVAHNRNIDAAATTHPGDGSNNVATWTANENVREVTIVIVDDTGESVQSDLACLVVVNAPTDAIAKQWLDDVGSSSQEVQYELVLPYQPLTIQRTSAITQIDVKPLGDTCRVVCSAVGD